MSENQLYLPPTNDKNIQVQKCVWKGKEGNEKASLVNKNKTCLFPPCQGFLWMNDLAVCNQLGITGNL